jgi:hypothetical protein
VLTSASGYFEAALSGRWATNNGDEMEIEDDPKIFQCLINFAHTGKIADTLPLLEVEYATKPANAEEWCVKLKDEGYEGIEVGCKGPTVSFGDLVELYAFADRRDATALSDHVVSIMLEKISAEGGLPVEMLEPLITKTVAGKDSLMFQMLVEVAARFVDSKDFEKHTDDIPMEFVVAVLGRQREIVLDEKLRMQEEMAAASKAAANPFTHAPYSYSSSYTTSANGTTTHHTGGAAQPTFSQFNFPPFNFPPYQQPPRHQPQTWTAARPSAASRPAPASAGSSAMPPAPNAGQPAGPTPLGTTTSAANLPRSRTYGTYHAPPQHTAPRSYRPAPPPAPSANSYAPAYGPPTTYGIHQLPDSAQINRDIQRARDFGARVLRGIAAFDESSTGTNEVEVPRSEGDVPKKDTIKACKWHLH